jgi:hypothetical protein
MAFLLRDLPFDDQTNPLLLPDGEPFLDETGQPLDILHDQIVFWGSLTPHGAATPPGEAGRFPVDIDTGFNDTFLIGEAQLRKWTGMTLANLIPSGSALRVSGRLTIAMYEADLWLHPNKPGVRDPAAVPAVRLELPDGIAVWPDVVPGGRRLPLLGLRALRWLGLRLSVDGATRLVSLENREP